MGRYSGPTDCPRVRGEPGRSEGQKASTSHDFTVFARCVSRIEKKIVLIDGEQLAQLMIDQGHRSR